MKRTTKGTVTICTRPPRTAMKDVEAGKVQPVMIEVPAYLYGGLALNRPYRVPDTGPGRLGTTGWVITHCASGWSVASTYRCPRTFQAARRAMLVLADHPKLDWTATVEEITAWPKATKRLVRNTLDRRGDPA